MKTTRYFETVVRVRHPEATEARIAKALQNRVSETVQTDGRIRVICYLPEENKYMRVIVLDDKETVHNAFYDRSAKRGIK